MGLEDIIRYESAAVAAVNVEKEKDLAVLAMENLYKVILGKDAAGDPIYTRALQEAAAGGDAGITNLGVVQAMQVYAGKYEKAFNSSKFSDLIKYLSEGYKISDEATNALSAYAELTIADLGNKAKDKETSKEDKEKIGKALQAIGMLKERRLRAKTMEIYNGVIKKNLDAMYPKEEKKEGEKK